MGAFAAGNSDDRLTGESLFERDGGFVDAQPTSGALVASRVMLLLGCVRTHSAARAGWDRQTVMKYPTHWVGIRHPTTPEVASYDTLFIG